MHSVEETFMYTYFQRHYIVIKNAMCINFVYDSTKYNLE